MLFSIFINIKKYEISISNYLFYKTCIKINTHKYKEVPIRSEKYDNTHIREQFTVNQCMSYITRNICNMRVCE